MGWGGGGVCGRLSLGGGQGSDIEIKVGWQEGVMDELQILHAVRHARI